MLILLLDGLDGTMARLSGKESAWGCVLDRAADRVSDGAVWIAVGVLCIREHQEISIILTLVAIIASNFQSYTAIVAKAVGVTVRLGIFQRLERMAVLFSGLTLTGLGVAPALDLSLTVIVLGCVGASTARLCQAKKMLSNEMFLP
jgi:CDP-diacylglycerol---glycerol-3-phosphate 3-phosphatidyltransferase